MMLKWNYKTNTYDPYEVPDDWNVSTFETDFVSDFSNLIHEAAKRLEETTK